VDVGATVLVGVVLGVAVADAVTVGDAVIVRVALGVTVAVDVPVEHERSQIEQGPVGQMTVGPLPKSKSLS
jgi:hypothetical protein